LFLPKIPPAETLERNRKIMDRSDQSEAPGLPLQGPHWHRFPDVEPGPAFFPLRLVLQSSGQVVELTRPDMIMGRHSEADVRIPLPDVSRRHCRFHFQEGRWHVSDLNSLNGLFVNDERVQQALLAHQDHIRVGGFIFQVDLRGGEGTVQVAGERQIPSAEVLKNISFALPQPPLHQ